MREKLEEMYNWFCTNINEIIKGHEGKFALLKDNAVQGYYDNDDEADLGAASKGFLPGEYLVQQCVPLEAKIVNYNWMIQYA